MRPYHLLFCVLLCSVLILPAQKKSLVPPNSPEEAALLEALREGDPAKRVALLDACVRKFPTLSAATQAHYFSAYLETKEWDKALESGRKAFEADPEDYAIAANMMKAAQGKGDNAAAVQWGSTAGGLLRKALAAKPEEEPLRSEFDQLAYSTYSAALKEPAGTRRVKALEEFINAFGGGRYVQEAAAALAVAHQQAGSTGKALAGAERAVKLNPNDESMHLLLGEAYLEQKRLDLALAHARSVQRILTTHPQPANMSKAEWAKHVKNHRGAAASIVGRVLMQQEKTEAAIPELNTASELLADNPQALAPVLYNLAYGYAKMRYFLLAKNTVARAVQIPGPYQALARQLEYRINKAMASAPRQ